MHKSVMTTKKPLFGICFRCITLVSGMGLQVAITHNACYNTSNESEGFIWLRYFSFAMAGFPRILKSPCASKENRFPKLNLPTVYQRNRRAKLAVNTQTPVRGRFCHRTGVFCNYVLFITAMTIKGFVHKHYSRHYDQQNTGYHHQQSHGCSVCQQAKYHHTDGQEA